MTASRRNITVDGELVDRAETLSVDVPRAAEAGIRSAVERAGDADLALWIRQNRDALRENAERDRTEGLVNASLRPFDGLSATSECPWRVTAVSAGPATSLSG